MELHVCIIITLNELVHFTKHYKDDQLKADEMGGEYSMHGTDEKTLQRFYRKPEGYRPRGKPRRRREGNIGTDLIEIVWEGVDWIHLAQDRDQWQAVVSTVMNLRVS
jgi:hypothetical protein